MKTPKTTFTNPISPATRASIDKASKSFSDVKLKYAELNKSLSSTRNSIDALANFESPQIRSLEKQSEIVKLNGKLVDTMIQMNKSNEKESKRNLKLSIATIIVAAIGAITGVISLVLH